MRPRSSFLVITALLAACSGGKSDSGAPVLDLVAPQSVRELATLTFDVHAAGPGAIALSATDLPDGATFTGTGATGTFSWTPAEGAAGTYDVTFTAASGGRSAQEVVEVVVARRIVGTEPGSRTRDRRGSGRRR